MVCTDYCVYKKVIRKKQNRRNRERQSETDKQWIEMGQRA